MKQGTFTRPSRLDGLLAHADPGHGCFDIIRVDMPFRHASRPPAI